MKFGNLKMPVVGALVGLCLGFGPAAAQTKPPESTSKVKKVLLYNKVGGWLAIDGRAAVMAAFSHLASRKGFELVPLATDIDITLDYLKQFQVIVWNNNTDGAKSVPSTKARQAVLDYLDQGGGWMLIHNAGDHANSWPGLAEALGTTFSRTGAIGNAEVVLDSAARYHRELKWMAEGFPEAFGLEDRWLNFANTVRPLPGVTVVATSRAINGRTDIIFPPADNSRDNVYIWAREIGKGRLLYNAIGYGLNNLMEKHDSIVPRLYWENLRYAAGDFQNGCTAPDNPGFDPAARVHDDGMCASVDPALHISRTDVQVSKDGRRLRLASLKGPFRVRLRDLRGALVWERIMPAGSGEVGLDGALRSGVYQLEIRGAVQLIQRRIILP